MASQRKIAANRANAKHSTGPKSAAGKAAVALNARKHGLNTPPERGMVARWYRIILNDPLATPNLLGRSPRLQAALRLAEAEARLERALGAEFEQQTNILVEADEINPLDAVTPLMKLCTDRRLHKIFRGMMRHDKRNRNSQLRKLRVLGRYRAEAEAKRRKALRHWIKHDYAVEVSSIPETKPSLLSPNYRAKKPNPLSPSVPEAMPNPAHAKKPETKPKAAAAINPETKPNLLPSRYRGKVPSLLPPNFHETKPNSQKNRNPETKPFTASGGRRASLFDVDYPN